MVQFKRCLGLAVTLGVGFGLLGACGDDGGSNVGGSYSSIASAIESPSGTVDESSAVRVGEEFGKLSATGVAAGMRRDAQVGQSQSGTMDCPAGGSISFTGSGNESSGQARGSYNGCCYSAGCCMDGTVNMFYSSAQSAAFAYCGSYDVSYSCEGVNADLAFNGCFGTTGEWVYVVEVDGESYAVSGTYVDGSGTLEISGENGTWTCTYNNDSGSCTGSGGDSFTF
jgi:hypothetical protein